VREALTAIASIVMLKTEVKGVERKKNGGEEMLKRQYSDTYGGNGPAHFK